MRIPVPDSMSFGLASAETEKSPVSRKPRSVGLVRAGPSSMKLKSTRPHDEQLDVTWPALSRMTSEPWPMPVIVLKQLTTVTSQIRFADASKSKKLHCEVITLLRRKL